MGFGALSYRTIAVEPHIHSRERALGEQRLGPAHCFPWRCPGDYGTDGKLESRRAPDFALAEPEVTVRKPRTGGSSTNWTTPATVARSGVRSSSNVRAIAVLCACLPPT